jgi:hypothetical protein
VLQFTVCAKASCGESCRFEMLTAPTCLRGRGMAVCARSESASRNPRWCHTLSAAGLRALLLTHDAARRHSMSVLTVPTDPITRGSASTAHRYHSTCRCAGSPPRYFSPTPLRRHVHIAVLDVLGSNRNLTVFLAPLRRAHRYITAASNDARSIRKKGPSIVTPEPCHQRPAQSLRPCHVGWSTCRPCGSGSLSGFLF